MRVAHLTLVGSLSAALASSLLGTPASAERVITNVGLYGGRATDERGVRSDATTLGAGLVAWPNGPIAFSFSGTGSRLGASAWQLGGNAGLDARTPEFARTALTLSGAASAMRASYGATIITGDATPALEHRVGALSLFGGWHVAAGRTDVRSQAVGASTPVVLVSQTRTLRAPVFGAVLRWPRQTSTPLSLAYHEERVRVEGEAVTDRNAGATLVWDRVTLGAGGGQRRSAVERIAYWSGSMAVRVNPWLNVQAVAGKYPRSLISGAAAGTYLSVGLQLVRGGAMRGSPLPSPRGVADPPRGMVRLSIRAPDAQRVDVAGDWNGWQPMPAERARNGVWYVDLKLPPGDYRYGFRIDGAAWQVPDGAAVTDDGFGGKSAFVTVARTADNRRTNF